MDLHNKKLLKTIVINVFAFLFLVAVFTPSIFAQASPKCVPIPGDTNGGFWTEPGHQPCIQVQDPGFQIPSLSDILTFVIRAVFLFGGMAALFFLILGAFSWITSGGEKDAISKAQAKIQAAVLGVIMIAVVLAIAVTLEQVVFAKKICFGLSCPLTIPSILK